MPWYAIDLNKKYEIPKEIKVIHHKDKVLVIAPTIATWIVLDSDKQVSVFDFLRNGHSIDETLRNVSMDKHDINFVVTQIEARRLYNKDVKDAVDGEKNLHRDYW